LLGCPISRSLATSCVYLEPRPLPSTGITRFQRYYDLSVTPGRPTHLSRAFGWSSLTTPRGFPCCARFPCVHAVATTPVQRRMVVHCSSIPSCQPSPKWLSGRPAHRLFRGLLGVHSNYGLHTRAVTVFRDSLNRRLQPSRYLHSCSGCFRLERFAGWGLHPLESAAFARRTPRGCRCCLVDARY